VIISTSFLVFAKQRNLTELCIYFCVECQKRFLQTFWARQHYAERAACYRPSVCTSVCLSHGCIIQKRKVKSTIFIAAVFFSCVSHWVFFFIKTSIWLFVVSDEKNVSRGAQAAQGTSSQHTHRGNSIVAALRRIGFNKRNSSGKSSFLNWIFWLHFTT